jgi:hypothetical protein
VLLPSAGSAAADQGRKAEPSATAPAGTADRKPVTRKPVGPQDERLHALLDGLERQIAAINANMANLGAGNAAAVRFRAATLAAYQRAWIAVRRRGLATAQPGVNPPAVRSITLMIISIPSNSSRAGTWISWRTSQLRPKSRSRAQCRNSAAAHDPTLGSLDAIMG